MSRLPVVYFSLLTLIVGPVALAAGQSEEPDDPLECAFLLASRRDPDELTRDDDLLFVARSHCLAGNHEVALQALSRISCQQRGLSAYTLAATASESKRPGCARMYLIRALPCLNSDADPRISLGLVTKSIEAHESGLASAIAASIENETSEKAQALTALAEAQVKEGRGDEAANLLARAVLQAKSADEDACRLFAQIGVAYSHLGELTQAAENLALARQLAEQEDEWNRELELRVVALASAEAGDEEAALEIVRGFSGDKPRAQAELATVLAKRGRKEAAAKLLSEAVIPLDPANYSDNSDLLKVVESYLQADAPAQAAAVARTITHEFYCGEAATAVADWYFKRRAIAPGISALDVALSTLRRIVSEKPEEILPMMSSSKAKSKASGLSQICRKYVEARQFEKALSAALAIDLPQWKARKLANVAEALGPASHQTAKAIKALDQALRLSVTSEEYPHDSSPVLALSAIARGYAAAGDTRRARVTFAQALNLLSKEQSEGVRIPWLAEVGLDFQEAGLTGDDQIRTELRNIVEKWAEN